MEEYFDELDTHSDNARERKLFDCLPEFLHQAVADCHGLAKHLNGSNFDAVTSREALSTLPVLRKTELMQAQQAHPPFGGFVRPEALTGTRVFMSPGPVWEFSYHLTPGGFILDEGATALGCNVFPAGIGNTEAQVAAMHHFSPVGFIGTPDYLKVILDAADESGQPITLRTVRHHHPSVLCHRRPWRGGV